MIRVPYTVPAQTTELRKGHIECALLNNGVDFVFLGFLVRKRAIAMGSVGDVPKDLLSPFVGIKGSQESEDSKDHRIPQLQGSDSLCFWGLIGVLQKSTFVLC